MEIPRSLAFRVLHYLHYKLTLQLQDKLTRILLMCFRKNKAQNYFHWGSLTVTTHVRVSIRYQDKINTCDEIRLEEKGNIEKIN